MKGEIQGVKNTSLLQEWQTNEVYYAAANSADGFRSYFQDIFGKTEHLYILKGGPGTGKSRFMEEAAVAAEKKGFAVERFRCSSDPDSLDGILIPEKGIGILDGTAPHMTDPKYPGAAEEIVNLGGFWDTAKLKARREIIQTQIDEKGRLYDRALKLIHLAGSLRREQIDMMQQMANTKKLDRTVAKLLAAAQGAHRSTRRPKEPGKISLRLMEAIGMKGRVRFTSLEAKAKTIYRLPAFFGGESILLQKLLAAAKEKGLSFTYSLSPLLPEIPDAIFFPETALLVIAGGENAAGKNDHPINLKRFFDVPRVDALRAQRPLLRYLAKEEDALLHGAELILEKVRALHFATEQIYISAMDFEAKEKFTKEFLGYML